MFFDYYKNKIPIMRAFTLIMLLILFQNTSSLTILSKSNCPSKFYVSRSNITYIPKEQVMQMSQQFFMSYNKQKLQQNIQQIVIQGNSQSLTQYINNSMIIFIILGILALSLTITLIICCIFTHTCPPNFIKRDLTLKPYTIFQFRFITFSFLILSVGIVLTSCIGFSYLPQLKSSIELTTCSIYVAMDSILNGQNSSGWGGFNNLYTKIQNVAEYLNDSLIFLTNLLSGDYWLIQQMKNMQEKTTDIYRNNNDSKMITPNPKAIFEAITNGYALPEIQSQFVTTKLGPLGVSGSLVDDIYKGLKITQVLSNKAYDIQLSAKRLLDSSSNLLFNTNTSLKTMEMYIAQLNQTTKQLNTFQTLFIQKYLKISLAIFQSFYGIQLIGGIMCMMGIIAVYYFQIWPCKMMSSIGWGLIGIGIGGLMIICYGTLGLGSLGYGFCTYFDNMLSQQIQYSKLSAYNSQNMFSRIDSCFYGNGNVLQKFNLGQQMSTVTSLFQNIKQYYDYQDQLSTNYIDKSIPLTRMTNWLVIIQNYKKGIFIDYNQNQKSDDNPNYSIQSLNSYTLSGSGKHICSKDRWVWDKINCTNTNQQIYQATSFQNGQALQTIKDAICISFNEKFSSFNNQIWSQGDFISRYKQIRSQCNQTIDTIFSYGSALIQYRNSRINLFQSITDQIQSLKLHNILFNNNISLYKSKLYEFQNSISKLSNAVSNSLDGLLVSNDCKKIVNSMKFVYNMFCVNTMYNVIKIGWTAVVLTVLALGCVIIGYMFTRMFGQLEKNNKIIATFTGVDDLSSQEDIQLKKNIQINNKDLNIMNDFEKLKILGIEKEKKKKDARKIVSYDSEDSSGEDQNPYANQLRN